MPKSFRIHYLVLSLLIISAFILAGCGSKAEEPRPTFEPTGTFVAAGAVTTTEDDNHADQEPTEVAIEPTQTAEPTVAPTEVPTQEVTQAPTVAPTEIPTEAPSVVAGDPAYGEYLFRNQVNPANSFKCITCHNPDDSLIGVGPYVYGIANVADSRVEGQTAEEYLHASIVDPSAHIAPPQDGGPPAWVDGVMPQNWTEVFTEEQINDIVAYLLTLDQELPE